jgi:hypothetical protein
LEQGVFGFSSIGHIEQTIFFVPFDARELSDIFPYGVVLFNMNGDARYSISIARVKRYGHRSKGDLALKVALHTAKAVQGVAEPSVDALKREC